MFKFCTDGYRKGFLFGDFGQLFIGTDRIDRQAVILGQLFSHFLKFGEQGEIFRG
jgi:hypothetical protein